jgi:hypothetical protein
MGSKCQILENNNNVYSEIPEAKALLKWKIIAKYENK